MHLTIVTRDATASINTIRIVPKLLRDDMITCNRPAVFRCAGVEGPLLLGGICRYDASFADVGRFRSCD
jgi:hypothetical protein